jgi:PAS domain S-box-containing protein
MKEREQTHFTLPDDEQHAQHEFAQLAEEDLRENEAQFRVLADTAPVMIWMSGPDALCTYVNRPWLELTGRTLEQEIGKGWAESVHPDDRERCLQTYLIAFNARENFRMEYRLRRADGAYRWILDTGVPLQSPGGAFAGYIGSCLDITDRKEAETELRASGERYRALVTASAFAVWRSGPRGEPISHSTTRLELIPESEQEARELGWLAVVHPDDRARAAQVWEEALRAGALYEDEFRVRTRDGSYRDFLVRGVPIRAADGSVCEWVGTDTDVTEQKRAAEALRQASAELARASRAMTVGEMAASIAHEVSQPLTAVVANAGACRRLLDVQAPDLDEIREAVEDILRDGTRASDVLTRIRAMLRQGAVNRERLELTEVVGEVVGLLQHELRSRSVSLRLELATGQFAVLGDRVQLQQVVQNLMINALDAMSGNERQPRELRVATRMAEPGWVEVIVRDTGVGLGSEPAEQIFDPFFTTKPEGMGMGLSIARKILEGHGGRLWATPNPDRGATFHFVLPTQDDA